MDHLDWPEDFSGENGNYNHICPTCKQVFMGGKHRITCRCCEAKPTLEELLAEACEIGQPDIWKSGNGFWYAEIDGFTQDGTWQTLYGSGPMPGPTEALQAAIAMAWETGK